MLRIAEEALTFDDVLLLPGYSEVMAAGVALTTRLTRRISLNIPLISSAMDTVTESRLAIAMAQAGGIGIIHKSMSVAEQADQVRRVKKYESGVVKDPITIQQSASLQELIELTSSNDISGVPVLNGDDLVGIVTRRDLRFETSLDKRVSTIMTPRDKLVTVKEGASSKEVQRLLHQHRIEKILVVSDDFDLRGMITVKDFDKAESFPHACKDSYGQLRVGASVGVGGDTDERVEALVRAGVDVFVVDTAHGHSLNVLNVCAKSSRIFREWTSSAATLRQPRQRLHFVMPALTLSKSVLARVPSVRHVSSRGSVFHKCQRSPMWPRPWRILMYRSSPTAVSVFRETFPRR